MRGLGILGWAAAALGTFLVVSLAFLVLANLGSSSENVRIYPESNVSTTGSGLEMALDEAEIESLVAGEDQTLTVTLTNGEDRPLRNINVLAAVSSEDTSLPDSGFYRQTVPELAAGVSREAEFELNLSASPESESYPAPEPPRRIIEVRATTPEGISVITTVILSVS